MKFHLPNQRGFVHIIPLFFISLLIISLSVAQSISSENSQKQKVGKVLSDRDGNEELTKQEEEAEEAFKKQAELEEEILKKSLEGTENSKSGSNSIKSKSEFGDTKTEVETEGGKTKVKVKNADGEFETEIEDGKEKTKYRFGGLKIEFEREGDKFVTKIKNELGEDVDLDEDEEEELLEGLEDKLEDDDIEIATGSAELGFVQKGRRVRTNFPLSINPLTGELFVTTPQGIKVVTILPDIAIQNMIKAGILTRTEEPQQPPSTTPEGTAAAQDTLLSTIENAGIELTDIDSEPAYVISGVRDQELLGLLPVEIKIKTTVSATDGRLIDIKQGFFSRFIDLFSF